MVLLVVAEGKAIRCVELLRRGRESPGTQEHLSFLADISLAVGCYLLLTLIMIPLQLRCLDDAV